MHSGVIDWRSDLLGWHGRYAEGLEMLQESATTFADCGSRDDLALTLIQMGIVNIGLGRYAQARAVVEEGLAVGPRT